jgi:hypothetical protein
MIRKGILALTISVLGTGNVFAEERPAQKPTPSGFVNWLRSRGNASDNTAKQSGKPASVAKNNKSAAAVERAVVSDAERQSVSIRRTSGGPQDKASHNTTQAVAAASGEKPTPLRRGPVPRKSSASLVSKAYQSNLPVRPVSASAATTIQAQPVPVSTMAYGQGYPQTGAALYPAPLPGIPHQVGGTSIANPAFQPHEMLYPHQYKAMYGPYYYQVHGGWMVTPFGVWSQENWKLKGTEVDVKYKSHISPFSFFAPPAIR